jgi:hypothetical protein
MQDTAYTTQKGASGNISEGNQPARAGQSDVLRAERYEIGTAIRFRIQGERGWHCGMTENISVTGVLIRASLDLDPNTAIEMKFVLPVELSGESAAEIICRGVIVRSSKCNPPSGAIVIASTITHSRFLRTQTEVRIS